MVFIGTGMSSVVSAVPAPCRTVPDCVIGRNFVTTYRPAGKKITFPGAAVMALRIASVSSVVPSPVAPKSFTLNRSSGTTGSAVPMRKPAKEKSGRGEAGDQRSPALPHNSEVAADSVDMAASNRLKSSTTGHFDGFMVCSSGAVELEEMIGWQDSAMRRIRMFDVLKAETGQQGEEIGVGGRAAWHHQWCEPGYSWGEPSRQ